MTSLGVLYWGSILKFFCFVDCSDAILLVSNDTLLNEMFYCGLTDGAGFVL